MGQLRFPVTRRGLSLSVWIGVPGTLTANLVAAGLAVPSPICAPALLDAGSDVTAVAQQILQHLALPPSNTTTTMTASGPMNVKLYEVSLSITDPNPGSGSPWMTLPNLEVLELATALPDADVLVGLDVLLQCRLLLDGPGRQFTLDF